MKTITLGRIKQLHAVGELGSFNNRVDTLLTSYRRDHDDTEINFEVVVLVGMNDKQKDLLTKWGFIEPESKFKDGDYIIHRNGKFMQIICRLSGSDTLYYEKESQYLFSLGSDDYNQSRLATPEEIEANTLIQPIKGEYMNHKFYGVIKVHVVDNTMNRFYLISKSGDIIKVFFGGTLHKEMTKATPEQIYSFNRPWNEGIEEARKYKDGQPCLVNCPTNPDGWFLRYANGKGFFYDACKKSGKTIITWDYHMPLNEKTIKNLPINE